VIARNDRVELAARGAAEDGIPRPRTGNVDAAILPRAIDGRPQDRFVFVADDAVLPGVGVQARERDARLGVAEARQLPRRQIDDVIEQLRVRS
jgi:hypothetical protein